jgi:hypothetical protein
MPPSDQKSSDTGWKIKILFLYARVGLSGEQSMHHRFKMREWQTVVVRIKRSLIPVGTKINTSLVIGTVAILIPGATILVIVMHPIMTLKKLMVR